MVLLYIIIILFSSIKIVIIIIIYNIKGFMVLKKGYKWGYKSKIEVTESNYCLPDLLSISTG